MAPVDILRAASNRELVNEDGDPIALELEPPLTDPKISEFEQTLPCGLPAEIRDLLRFSTGFQGAATDLVDFTGASCNFAHEEVFPFGLPFAADGYGNFWVVDLTPESTTWGPIYFACHDAPVILYQSRDLEEFLVELFKMSEPPHQSLIDDVHEDRLFNVWRKNPGVKAQAECVNSPDAVVAAFARELEPGYQIIDMRNAAVGFGFSWGRYGPRTTIRRHGTLPLFAYRKP